METLGYESPSAPRRPPRNLVLGLTSLAGFVLLLIFPEAAQLLHSFDQNGVWAMRFFFALYALIAIHLVVVIYQVVKTWGRRTPYSIWLKVAVLVDGFLAAVAVVAIVIDLPC